MRSHPCCSLFVVRSVEKSPTKASPSQKDDVLQESQETGPKVVGEVPCAQILEELATVTSNQAALVAQLKVNYAGEQSLIAQKDNEIA